MSTRRGSRIGAWLLAATVALIVYGSLFPFRFVDVDERTLRSMLDVGLERPTRGDLVANMMLYAPLGFCIALVLARPGRHAAAFFAAIAGGLLLSFSMETLQAVSVWRVASLTDIVLNGIGTIAGAAVGAVCTHRAAATRIARLAPRDASHATLAVLILWLAARLAPFVPTIDWQKYKEALEPLLFDPELGARAVLVYAVGWLVVAYALRVSWPAAALRAWLVTAAFVVAGQVVVVAQTVSLSEAVALALCLPVVALLGRCADRTAAAALAAGVVAVVVFEGLEPFTFSATAKPFSWIPLAASITGGLEFGYTVMLEKSFWYASAVWLVARAGAGLLAAAIACAVLLGAIEAAQMFLPGRTPEITDPLLALGLAWLLAVLAAPARTVRDRAASGA